MDDRGPVILAEQFSPQALWTIIALSAAFVIYVALRPMLGGKKKDPLAAGPIRLSVAQQKAIERDMQNVLVELANMSRDMTAALETRATKLELLIADANRSIARLETLRAELGGSAVAPVSPPTGLGTPSVATLASPFDQPMRAIREPTNLAAPAERYARLYELQDQGLDARTIAVELGRPAGEVELILALRPRQAADD